jgi:exosortase
MAAAAATALAFAALFWHPVWTLLQDWWGDPDAAHGLLLVPVALYLAWQRRAGEARPQPLLGLALLGAAVLLRYVAGIAAELFTLRLSIVAAAAALVVWYRGFPQLSRWWLSAALLVLAIPIPDILLNALAIPLQLEASRLGAWLLEQRHVPVRLAGNVILLPGRSLFVTEACSGLRSLTALVALGLVVGGLWLHGPLSRVLLLSLAIPVAIALNVLRVFLTGYLTHYVNPALADGFLHYSEGWVLFIAAFGALGGLAWGLRWIERTREEHRHT